MRVRVRVIGEITKGEFSHPKCPLTRYGPHRHEIEGQLLEIDPDDADEIRAGPAGLGADLWGGE